MKNILLFLLFPLLFLSCGSDDDDDNTNSTIVGTWEVKSVEADEVITDNEEVTQFIKDSIRENEVAYQQSVFIFFADGQFTNTLRGELNTTGQYTLKGNILTMVDEEGVESSTISISGKSLYMVFDITEDQEYEDVNVSKVTVKFTLERK